MKIFYSKTEKAFFCCKHKIKPSDAVQITHEEHRTLLKAESQGAELHKKYNNKGVTVANENKNKLAINSGGAGGGLNVQ